MEPWTFWIPWKNSELTSEEPDWLERRWFECVCGRKAMYLIYERNEPYFVSCDCGKNFQFNWATDKFVSDAPKEFSLMEDEDEENNISSSFGG